jgi:hypothetical protein
MLLDRGFLNRPRFRSSATKGDLARKVGLKSVVGSRSSVFGFNDSGPMTDGLTTNDGLLLTVQLHNQLLVYRQLDIFALGQR